MILKNRSHVNMCISKSINQFHTFLKLCTAGTYYFALHTCYIPLDILKSASFSSWGCLLWMHKLSKLWKRNAKNKCATFSFLVFTIHFKHNLRQFSEITNDKKDVIAIKKDFFLQLLKDTFYSEDVGELWNRHKKPNYLKKQCSSSSFLLSYGNNAGPKLQ